MTNTENWVSSNVLEAITAAAAGAQARRHGNMDATARLRSFVEVANGAQQMLKHQVGISRSLGMSWQEIGDTLGMSKQAAWERFRD